jgi:hypothetical protein
VTVSLPNRFYQHIQSPHHATSGFGLICTL